MIEPVRIGILGASSVSTYALIAPAKFIENAKIIAVAARDVNRAKQFAIKYGIPKVHDNYENLLLDPEIDAIYIGLPNSHHCEWSIKSLQAGKHVLCEKPLANNEEEARKMSEAVHNSNGLIFMEAFHYRYHPMAKRIKEVIKNELGNKVKHAEVKLKFPPMITGKDIRYNYKLGGGSLMDCGCYTVNCLRYILEEEPEVVSAEVDIAYPYVDQSTRATFKTQSGKTGAIECSFYSMLSANVHVIGENGAELWVYNFVAPHILYNKLTVKLADGKIISESLPKNISSYGEQLKAFISAVRMRDYSKVLTPVEYGIKNMRVIDNIYKRAGLPVRGTPVQGAIENPPIDFKPFMYAGTVIALGLAVLFNFKTLL